MPDKRPPRPQKGERWGGRAKGTPNKRTLDLKQRFEELGYNPHDGMIAIASNYLPCGTCRGELRTRYMVPKDSRKECDHKHPVTGAKEKGLCLWCSGTDIRDIDMRTCQSCYGTSFEACSPDLRGRMHAELAQYVEAKRKAIEHSGSEDKPPVMVTVKYVG